MVITQHFEQLRYIHPAARSISPPPSYYIVALRMSCNKELPCSVKVILLYSNNMDEDVWISKVTSYCSVQSKGDRTC